MDTTAIELKSYQQLIVDEDTGEEVVADMYTYLPGRPREYRFNGQNGQFNLYGERILMDDKGKPLNYFIFQPISYRFFEDTLFGRTEKEMWAELFFIDAQNCVSAIMFNNTTVAELFRLMEPMHYEKISLLDVVLTVKAEYVRSQKDPSKAWYIGRFSYNLAPKEVTHRYREYVNDRPVFRAETINPHADIKVMSRAYEKVINNEAHLKYFGFPKAEDIIAIPENTES
jgi:hypothetical protein